MFARLTQWQSRAEMILVGPLSPDVRRSMYIDLRAAVTGCLFAAILNFIPIILRRMGATVEQLAFYYAVTALGLLTTGLSVWLMRRFDTRRVAMLSWVIGRATFLLTALATNVVGLLSIFSLFWVLEAWPGPAYVQTLQIIYPAARRARVMALVRVGMVGGILVLTPLAGWILDRWGYRALLPLAGASGVGSTLIFFPLLRRIAPGGTAPSRYLSSPWQLTKSDPRLAIYLVGTLLFGLAVVISSPLYPAVQVDRLNLSYTAVGLLGFVQSLFWFLGYLFGGRLVDRFGGIRCLQAVSAVNAIVLLPYIWATQGWMLAPSFAAAGLVAAGADLAVLTAIMDLAGTERTPDYAAANAIFTGVRGLAGPFLGSFLIQLGAPLWTVFAACAGLTLAGAVILGFIARPAGHLAR